MEAENRVLLVEDGAPLRRSLEKFLERAGYAFDSCATAGEALVLAEKMHHATVIVEYRLPDADGVVLLKKLNRIIPDARAIMVSEFDYQTVVSELSQAKVCSFLQKPFDPVELEAALSSSRSNCETRIPFEKIEWKIEMSMEGIPAPLFK